MKTRGIFISQLICWIRKLVLGEKLSKKTIKDSLSRNCYKTSRLQCWKLCAFEIIPNIPTRNARLNFSFKVTSNQKNIFENQWLPYIKYSSHSQQRPLKNSGKLITCITRPKQRMLQNTLQLLKYRTLNACFHFKIDRFSRTCGCGAVNENVYALSQKIRNWIEVTEPFLVKSRSLRWGCSAKRFCETVKSQTYYSIKWT